MDTVARNQLQVRSSHSACLWAYSILCCLSFASHSAFSLLLRVGDRKISAQNDFPPPIFISPQCSMLTTFTLALALNLATFVWWLLAVATQPLATFCPSVGLTGLSVHTQGHCHRGHRILLAHHTRLDQKEFWFGFLVASSDGMLATALRDEFRAISKSANQLNVVHSFFLLVTVWPSHSGTMVRTAKLLAFSLLFLPTRTSHHSARHYATQAQHSNPLVCVCTVQS